MLLPMSTYVRPYFSFSSYVYLLFHAVRTRSKQCSLHSSTCKLDQSVADMPDRKSGHGTPKYLFLIIYVGTLSPVPWPRLRYAAKKLGVALPRGRKHNREVT